jgi:hypothetical protein
VARLDLKVETLAEAHTAAQARLDGLIQAAHRHQEALERSELALQATRAAYAGDVRDLYARGPLVPLELVLAADDFHELAVAAGVANGAIDRDVRALSSCWPAARRCWPRPGPRCGPRSGPLGSDRAGVVRLLGAGPLRLRRRRAVAAPDLTPAVVGRPARPGGRAASR